MFKLALLFACLSGYAFLYRRLLGVPYAVAPALIVASVIAVSFAADFIGMLEAATYLLYCIGWSAFGCILYLSLVRRSLVPSAEKILPMALAAVLCIWLYRLKSAGAYHDWDEFSHWGTVIKAVFSANTFHFDPNPLYFQDYPPGTALFSYFVLKLLGYSEGNAFFAYDLIVLAYCAPAAALLWRNGVRWLVPGIAAMLVLLSKHGLGSGWSTTLIDHILSVMMGGIIGAYLLLARDKARLWPLSVMLTALVLTKHAGQPLALLAVAICAIDMLVHRMVGTEHPRQRFPGVPVLGKVASTAIGLLVLPLIVGKVWRHFVVASGLSQSVGGASLAELLVKAASCCNAREADIAGRFVDRWLGLPEIATGGAGTLPSVVISNLAAVGLQDITSALRHFSPAMWFIVLLCVGLAGVLVNRNNGERVRLLGASLLLAGGAAAFALTHLLFYLYAMSDYEAKSLASFDRFENTYLLGWSLAAVALTAIAAAKAPVRYVPRMRHWVALALFGVLPFVVSDHAVARLRLAAPAIEPERAAIRTWVLPQLAKIPESGRVYIVWQGTSGLEFWMIRHEILPRNANVVCFSLGPPHFPDDIWSCPNTESRMQAEWENYDYVLVGHGLADLKSNYPALLAAVPDGVDRGVLQVRRNATATPPISLVPVPEDSPSQTADAGRSVRK